MTNRTISNSYAGADSLLNKLAIINTPKMTPLLSGNSETVEDLWKKVIYPLLPAKDVMLRWHKVLMEYVKSPSAMFAIRGYNTAQRDNYHQLRRGFLTRTSEGYSFFYTDNFHAAYILKLAIDGVVPSVDALLSVYNSRKFPSRFGRDTGEERELRAIPQGKNPGIHNAGYKLAHIYNVGKDYSGTNATGIYKNCSLIRDIVDVYFPRGERNDWRLVKDETGPHYERYLSVLPEARPYLIAAFLRFVHPFNYFLVPKKTCASVDVSENPHLIAFVRSKMREIYGAAYDEFESYIKLPHKRSTILPSGSYGMKLTYGNRVAHGEKLAAKPQNYSYSGNTTPPKVSRSSVRESSNDVLQPNIKIGRLVNTEVRRMLESGLCSDNEVAMLMDKSYCHEMFNANFPVLVRELVYTGGVRRYYVKPLMINGQTYYLSSQWYARQRSALERWIAKHSA